MLRQLPASSSQNAGRRSNSRNVREGVALSGGGPLMDVGSHRIDLLNYFFGDPKLSGAAVSRQTQQTPGFKVEDNATLTIDYTGAFGPVRAVLDVRWNSHVSRDEFRIIGTDGEIDLTPLDGVQQIVNRRCRNHPELRARYPRTEPGSKRRERLGCRPV